MIGINGRNSHKMPSMSPANIRLLPSSPPQQQHVPASHHLWSTFWAAPPGKGFTRSDDSSRRKVRWKPANMRNLFRELREKARRIAYPSIPGEHWSADIPRKVKIDQGKLRQPALLLRLAFLVIRHSQNSKINNSNVLCCVFVVVVIAWVIVSPLWFNKAIV